MSEDMIYPAPYCRTWTPIKKWRDKIVMVGFFGSETSYETPTNRPVIIISDTDNGTVEYAVNYPEQYSNYNWGGGYPYRLPSYDLVDGTLVVSFAAHHELICHSLLTGEEKSHYAGSTAIPQIKSFPEPKILSMPKDTKVFDWYYKSPSYEGIYYDRYKNLYYRIAKLPVPEENRVGDLSTNKPTVVIVLDSELNYVGECALPEDIVFRTVNCFVSQDGLNIQVLTGDEDKMTFYQYTFEEK